MKVSGFLFLFPLATISIYVEKKKQTTKKKSKGGLLLIDWRFIGLYQALAAAGFFRLFFFSSTAGPRSDLRLLICSLLIVEF